MSRGGFKINIDHSDDHERGVDGPIWFQQFANKLINDQKTAVEVARERDNEPGPSIFERMNAIMGGGKLSPYSSVDEAVQDYKKRTGLADYQKIAMAQEIMEAGEKEDLLDKPEILKQNPAVESYIRNLINTQRGIQLPAILHSVRELFGRDVRETDLDSPDLIKYINYLIGPSEKSYNSNDINLGRGVGIEPVSYEMNDPNRDPFAGLLPRRF